MAVLLYVARPQLVMAGADVMVDPEVMVGLVALPEDELELELNPVPVLVAFRLFVALCDAVVPLLPPPLLPPPGSVVGIVELSKPAKVRVAPRYLPSESVQVSHGRRKHVNPSLGLLTKLEEKGLEMSTWRPNRTGLLAATSRPRR